MSSVFTSFRDELEKVALIERLVRLAATDVPHTPRLLMRNRAPHELAALQDAVESAHEQRVSKPFLRAASKLTGKMAPGKLRSVAEKATSTIGKDPIGIAASSAIPVPGATAGYLAGKRALEGAIDRFAPLTRQ
jgi:hypothetical protein